MNEHLEDILTIYEGGKYMKKTWYLSVLFLVIIMLFGCRSDNEVSYIDNPYRAAQKVDFYASTEAFSKDFEMLFADEIDTDFIDEKYELVKQHRSNSSRLTTMTLVRYENNQAILVILGQDSDNDEYKVYDVIEVPEEVKH